MIYLSHIVIIWEKILKEIPKVPSRVAREGSKEDVEKIRQWARTYGDSTRQLSFRAKSTKDNPGTLPISTYGRRRLPNNPASLEDFTERLQEEGVTADVNEENVETEESIALVANKDDVILIAKFKEITGPFILGKLAQNLKRTSSKVKTHLCASNLEDCLIFSYKFTAQVE